MDRGFPPNSTAHPRGLYGYRCPLWVAIAASILLHLTLAAFLAPRLAELEASATPLRPVDRKPAPHATLGIERSPAVTMTWLGYEEAKPHEAPKADVEQAAFTLKSARAAIAQSAAQASERAVQMLGSLRAAFVLAARTMPAGEVPITAAEPVPATPDPPDAAANPAGAPSGAAEPSPPADPGEAGEPGEASDRESDAASLEPPAEAVLGQPVAAEGLEIKTRRPDLSITARLRGGARNPVVHITFGRNGRVLRADYKEGMTTGNTELDTGLRASIFTWTATGENLEKIDPDDPRAGITVTLKLLF